MLRRTAVILAATLLTACTIKPATVQKPGAPKDGATVSNLDKELKNQALDDIIVSRRTIRDFRPEAPPEEAIRKVITAGIHAPFVMSAVENFKDGYFRRFFVLRNGGESMSKASDRYNEKVRELAADLEKKAKTNPVFEKKSRSWRSRLKWFHELGHVPGVTNAPYLIIIADHRGIPDMGQHALAHCLENMWLKATALDLAFQIISVTSKLGDDPAFCALLGLKPGEWDLMGCAVGYAKQPLGPSQRPPADEVTLWLP